MVSHNQYIFGVFQFCCALWFDIVVPFSYTRHTYTIWSATTRRHEKNVKSGCRLVVASYSSGVDCDHVGRRQEWANTNLAQRKKKAATWMAE